MSSYDKNNKEILNNQYSHNTNQTNFTYKCCPSKCCECIIEICNCNCRCSCHENNKIYERNYNNNIELNDGYGFCISARNDFDTGQKDTYEIFRLNSDEISSCKNRNSNNLTNNKTFGCHGSRNNILNYCENEKFKRQVNYSFQEKKKKMGEELEKFNLNLQKLKEKLIKEKKRVNSTKILSKPNNSRNVSNLNKIRTYHE